MTDLDLTALRANFPILARTNYLNSCSLGALSKAAEAELGDFREQWHLRGASAWYEHWMGKLSTLRARAGEVHGASEDETALMPSVSAALSMITESMPRAPIEHGRNRVICSELDFPTLAYQFRVKPEIELVPIRSEDGIGIDLEQYEDAIDDRTLMVATSHVFYATGFIQDISAIADIAHRSGAWCVIDGYQASGQIPVDVTDAGVDAYVTGPLKWLCGGPGLGYAFVRHHRIEELTPRFTSWFAAKDQFAFDFEHFEFRDDARRFELGTPPLATVHMALGAHRLLESIGFDTIYARDRELTDHLVVRLREEGFSLRMRDDEAHRSNIVMIATEDEAQVVADLADAGIVVDHRPGHVRVSAHFYNTIEELDHFVDELVRIRDED
ncbi:MAG TPA: aminotransferase class V-fold PLP-dependent enzyme [Longimicrobiales bacterium]|nr:aminotransferase class V-fold PLP-dependent enzyme [Longimicrobiales bacterium]